MAKTKNKKRNLAAMIDKKKKSENVKKLNPFELHINREKMKVLGRVSKHSKGLPGVSRMKAIEKRKGTLLQEYKSLHKANRFMDKRIGERNHNLTEEDRTVARFTAVRTKAHKKKSIFNLADDEILTHRGQTLNEIEKFDDPRSDDESDDNVDSSGKLTSDFVEDAHFGGGILSKSSNDGAKSHKDLINQLIAESKKRKAEKQMTKEKTLKLTEQLDADWKDLIPIINKTVKPSDAPAKPDIDDYDKAIRELKFDARGHPSEPLKPESQIAQEEKETLEKLESERLARMRGITEKATAPKHHSADDLDDGFAYDSDPGIMVSYNEEGTLNVEHESEKEESDDHNESKEEEEEDDENNETEAEDNNSDEDEDETASEDDLSDLKNDDSEDEDIHEEEKPTLSLNDENVETDVKYKSAESDEHSKKIKADLLLRKEMMEKARKELPYTYEFPESYEQLKDLFENRSPEHQSIIVERVIKCTHPSLNENNKEKLKVLFAYLLQYINDLSTENINICFSTFNNLVPQLFDLAQLNKENAQSCMMEVIKEKHLEYRKNKKVYPGIEVLLFLKIVSCLFPTSDFRHQVVTPCVVFMDQMLQKCKPKCKKDIAYGLFLITLILEYTSLSKRYLPAVINFLGGIFYMSIPKSGIKLAKILPPFQSTSSALVLYKNCSALNIPLQLECSDLLDNEISEDFKIKSLYLSLKLISEFKDNFKELPSRKEIFYPILYYLEQIPICNYPQNVQNEIANLIVSLKTLISDIKLEFIVMEAKRPKALKLYTPNIVKVYDVKKRRMQSKETAEQQKLLHKLKREHKGALREIRRDRAFLGRIQIKQRIQSDKERKEKVKRIYGEASLQQGELNALDRKKKRK